MKNRILFVAFLGLASVSGGIAQADSVVLFNSLEQETDYGSDTTASGGQFASFSTSATTTGLSDLKMFLGYGGLDSSISTIGLYSDSSTNPGSLIATLGTVDEATAAYTPTVYDFSFATPISVSASTRYWIGIIGDSSSQLSWYMTYIVSGVGVINEYSNYGDDVGYSYANDNLVNGTEAFEMEVTGVTTPSVVPEPSSLALCGIAALGGSVYAARRRRRAVSR